MARLAKRKRPNMLSARRFTLSPQIRVDTKAITILITTKRILPISTLEVRKRGMIVGRRLQHLN